MHTRNSIFLGASLALFNSSDDAIRVDLIGRRSDAKSGTVFTRVLGVAVIGDNFDGPIMPSRLVDTGSTDRRRVDPVAQPSFSEHLKVANESNASFAPVPGGLPFDKQLYRANKIDRAAEPRVDELTRRDSLTHPTYQAPERARARPTSGGVNPWPRLADVSPVPEVREIQESRTVYQIEIPPQSGSFLDLIC